MKRLAKLLLGAAAISVAATTAQADPMTTPAMSGPLSANPNPLSFDLGWLGKTYVTGAVSGVAFAQSNAQKFFPKDNSTAFDLSNGEVFIQKTDGTFQYFVQVGQYSLPSLGAPYIKSTTMSALTFGAVPVAYGKVVLSDNFSIQAGKLPTLIGDEYTFTFQNMNVERGLLWNQEPAISQGVQANFTSGPFSLSLSWNDGFYSHRWDWLSGLASMSFNGGSDILAVAGGSQIGGSETPVGGFATPYFQNTGSIWNVIYTHISGPWTISPYFQYANVPSNTFAGTTSADTYGGAILVSYGINDNWKLAGRVEYETSTGNALTAPNLMYGVGSDAYSFTITPTYQQGVFFARLDGSYTGVSGITPGLGLGPAGTSKNQVRGMLEFGILF